MSEGAGEQAAGGWPAPAAHVSGPVDWELVARWPGGAVTALAASTGAVSVLLATTPAGLHRSEDGGKTWRWLALGPDPTPECLVAAPQPATATSLQAVAGTLLLGAGSGAYRSTDGGATWRAVLAGSRVQCLAASGNLDADGVALAGTEADGILRSEDGGRGWIGANAGLIDLDVMAVAVSPAFARDRTAFAGTASGLFRSRNSGRAWRLLELGPASPAVQAIAVSPFFPDDGQVFAGTESDGLYRSVDGGQTWGQIVSFPEPCVTSIVLADDDARTLLVGTAAGVAVSSDGGYSWRLEAPELGPILSLTFASDGAALAGTIDQGVIRRAPDGSGWQPANAGLAGRATVGMAVTMAFGDEPLIAVASLDAGVLLSHDAGRSWKTGHAGLRGLAATSLAFVRQADGQPALLTTFADGLYVATDIEAGWQWVSLPDLDLPGGARPTCLAVVGDLAAVGSQAADGGQASPAIVLAAGSRCLLLSGDAGVSWRTLPLPRPDAEIVQVAASPDFARDQTLYLAVRAFRFERDGSRMYDGLELWRSDDLGAGWSRWHHDTLASVMPLAPPCPGALPASVLIGRSGGVSRPLPQTAERRGGEVRPLWQTARIGSPGEVVAAVALSPHVRQDRLVMAAGGGIPYLSQDGGETFVAWDSGIQTPLVTALAIVELPDSHLAAYALGLGGTLWRCLLS